MGEVLAGRLELFAMESHVHYVHMMKNCDYRYAKLDT